jgi:hypothetical protein
MQENLDLKTLLFALIGDDVPEDTPEDEVSDTVVDFSIKSLVELFLKHAK